MFISPPELINNSCKGSFIDCMTQFFPFRWWLAHSTSSPRVLGDLARLFFQKKLSQIEVDKGKERIDHIWSHKAGCRVLNRCTYPPPQIYPLVESLPKTAIQRKVTKLLAQCLVELSITLLHDFNWQFIRHIEHSNLPNKPVIHKSKQLYTNQSRKDPESYRVTNNSI